MSKKSIATNSIFNIIYSGLNVLFPMITSMYVSRVLRPYGIGIVASAQNIATYFVMMSALGIPIYGVKEIGKFQNDFQKRNIIFSELFIINTATTLISSVCFYVLIFSSSEFLPYLNIYVLVGLLVISNFFNVDWFYQGIEEFKFITIRSFVVKLMLLVFMFVFIRNETDIVPYVIISCLSTTANYICNIIYLKKHVRFKLKGINITKHIKHIFMLSLVVLALEIYSLCDTTMLTFMCDENTVGYYANVVKIKNIVVNTLLAVLNAIMPRLSLYYQENALVEFNSLVNKGQKAILFFAIPMSIGIILLANDIVLFMFGSDFLPSSLTLQISSIAMMIIPIGQLLGYRMLVLTDNESKMVLGFVGGALINVILNYFLIQKFQQNGAMIASVLCELFVASVNVLMARRFIKLKISKRFFVSEIIAIICMVVGVLLLQQILNGYVWRLFFSILIGGVVYLVTCLALKNDFAIYMLSLIKKELSYKSIKWN